MSIFYLRNLCSRCVRAGKFAFVLVRFLFFAFMACQPATVKDYPVITGGRLPCPMIVDEVKVVEKVSFFKLGMTHKAIAKFLFGRGRVKGSPKAIETIRSLRAVASAAAGSPLPPTTSVKANGLLCLGLNAPTRKRKFSDSSVVEAKIGDWAFNILSDSNRRRDVWMELTGENLQELFSLVQREEASATSEDGASTTTASPSSDEAKASPLSDANKASASPHEDSSEGEEGSDPDMIADIVYEQIGERTWQVSRRRWVLRFRQTNTKGKPTEKVFTPDRTLQKEDPDGARACARALLDEWAAVNLKPPAL